MTYTHCMALKALAWLNGLNTLVFRKFSLPASFLVTPPKVKGVT